MASSTTPRTPPPSKLRILIPAVGGMKLNVRGVINGATKWTARQSKRILLRD